MEHYLFQLNIGLTRLSSPRPIGHCPRNLNFELPAANRGDRYARQLGSAQRLPVFRQSVTESESQGSSLPSFSVLQQSSSSSDINYHNIIISIDKPGCIYNLLVTNQLSLNIYFLIKQLVNKCLRPGHKAAHYIKFIESMGLPNLTEFIVKDPVSGNPILSYNNNFELNPVGEESIKQAGILYAGYIVKSLLYEQISKIAKKKVDEDPRYLSKLIRAEVKNFDSFNLEIIQNNLVEFKIQNQKDFSVTLRSIFRIRYVTLEDGRNELILSLPSCFPPGDRQSRLNPSWAPVNLISKAERKKNWESTKMIFKPTFLVDILYNIYKNQNSRLSDKSIYKRIRRELRLRRGNTYPDFNEIFHTIE